jgi:hypothetical protein
LPTAAAWLRALVLLLLLAAKAEQLRKHGFDRLHPAAAGTRVSERVPRTGNPLPRSHATAANRDRSRSAAAAREHLLAAAAADTTA